MESIQSVLSKASYSFKKQTAANKHDNPVPADSELAIEKPQKSHDEMNNSTYSAMGYPAATSIKGSLVDRTI